MDLARNMIRMAGQRVNADIDYILSIETPIDFGFHVISWLGGRTGGFIEGFL